MPRQPPASSTPPAARRPGTIRIRRRLLAMLIAPLIVLGLFNAWHNYDRAIAMTAQQDMYLQKKGMLLADALIGTGHGADAGHAPGELLLGSQMDDLLNDPQGSTRYAVYTPDGILLHGDSRLPFTRPAAGGIQTADLAIDGITHRIVIQQRPSLVGQVVVMVADIPDPHTEWQRDILSRVLLPNLLVIGLMVPLIVNWAVLGALLPMRRLTRAVQQRTPEDLSPIDTHRTPEEVLPLVEALNHLFERVRTQTQTRKRFIADAAHQLRTPQAALQARIEAWCDAADRQQAAVHHGTSGASSTNSASHASSATDSDAIRISHQALIDLRDATRRTSRLLNQLLALSRVEGTPLPPHQLQTVDLPQLCEDLLVQHYPRAAEQNMDFGLEQQPATALAHPLWIQELVSNLLDNALHYTPAGGTITLRCGQCTADGPTVTATAPLHHAADADTDEDPAQHIDAWGIEADSNTDLHGTSIPHADSPHRPGTGTDGHSAQHIDTGGIEADGNTDLHGTCIPHTDSPHLPDTPRASHTPPAPATGTDDYFEQHMDAGGIGPYCKSDLHRDPIPHADTPHTSTPNSHRPAAAAGAGAGADWVYIAVEDSGPGIAVDERAHVLQPFYRIPGSSGEGTGLGLAIAHEIAQQHGGTLHLADGPGGRGLCISLLLPAHRPQAAIAATAADPAATRLPPAAWGRDGEY